MTEDQTMMLDTLRRSTVAVAAMCDAMLAMHKVLRASLGSEAGEEQEQPSDPLDSRAVFGRKLPTSPDEVPE